MAFFCLFLISVVTRADQVSCSAIFENSVERTIIGSGEEGVAFLTTNPWYGLIVEKQYRAVEYRNNDLKAFEVLDHIQVKSFRNAKRLLVFGKTNVAIEYVPGTKLDVTLSAKNSEAIMAKYENLLEQIAQELQFRYRFHITYIEIYSLQSAVGPRLSVRLKINGDTIRILLKPDNFIYDGNSFVLFDPH